MAVDVFAPYDIISNDGERQTATVTVTDFRMIMANDRGGWLWDGWDLEDVSVDIRDRPA